jgi:hypothetical protein
MRRLLWLASGVLVSFCAPANATTFYWEYFGSGIAAAGTFDATDQGGGNYLVTSIFGTRNGIAIDGLTGYAFNDNIIMPASSPNQLTFNGLAFSVAGVAHNVFYQFENESDNVWTCFVPNSYCELTGVPFSGGQGDLSIPISFRLSDVPLTATPLPAALPLYATGLGIIGFIAWRRKRKREAAMAS